MRCCTNWPPGWFFKCQHFCFLFFFYFITTCSRNRGALFSAAAPASLCRLSASHRLFLRISLCFLLIFPPSSFYIYIYIYKFIYLYFPSTRKRHNIFVYLVISSSRVRSPAFVYTGQISGELSAALSVSNELQPLD